jgi:hypothetical protein
MDQATQTNRELSILKTANISGFLLNIDEICRIISTARECIGGCGVESNPFSLESMTTICSQPSVAAVGSVTQCLRLKGDAVAEKCADECGNYDDITEEIHQRTQSFRPEANNPEQVSHVMEKINEGCRTLKCSDRCTVRELNQQCPENNAGEVVQSIIESVLVAQRRDLERMGLVDTMAQNMPPHCTYMYTPEVMFDSVKDKAAHPLITEEKQALLPSGSARRPGLSQLQALLLKKQIHLLSLQEQNLERESQKLDMEMELLARKRARFSEGVPKVYPRF